MNPSSVWNRLDTVPRAGDGRSGELIEALICDVPAPFTVRGFHPLPGPGVDSSLTTVQQMSPGHAFRPPERGVGGDQTNHSVVVGESVVVKWLTPPAPLPHPAPEVLAHLTEVGFTATATPYAAVFRRGGGEDELLALVTAYLPEARDGWEWCVDEAVAGRTDFAADLGALAAGLHAAMATPSTVVPTPVRRAPVHRGPGTAPWRARAEEALREALALTGGPDGEWLAAHADVLRAEFAPLASAGTTPLIRIHGDLHVGQFLRWRGGYAVIDFDGNPTVTAADPYQPAARDLAQLRTSLEHVGQVAVRRRDADPVAIGEWATAVRAVLESAYLARLGELGHTALLDRSLVRAFEIEQECRELVYAARRLPRWSYAPMGVLRSRYGRAASASRPGGFEGEST